MTIKFNVKDGGYESLVQAISGILRQEAIYGDKRASSYSAGGFIVKCSAKQKTNKKGATIVNIRFSAAGAGRKALAQAVGEIIGEDAVYSGTPNFNYTIGGYAVDRSGVMICPDNISTGEISQLVADLRERGYEAVESAADETPDYGSLRMTEREELGLGRERRDPIGEDGPHPSDVPEPDDSLTIDMPLDGFGIEALENLKKIVVSKESLIKKALGADDLPIQIIEDRLSFPWFTLTGADGEADAYMRFVSAMCEMAKKQKRVNTTEKPSENDKFAMRIFLIRLGFNGSGFKTARQILMRNLEGNTAWKNGNPSVRTVEDTNAETQGGEANHENKQ